MKAKTGHLSRASSVERSRDEGYAPEAREIGVGSWELGKLATKGTKGAWERSFACLSFVDVMPKAVRAKPGWRSLREIFPISYHPFPIPYSL